MVEHLLDSQDTGVRFPYRLPIFGFSILMRRKYKPTFEKDYNFYLNQRHVFTFAGSEIGSNIQYSEKGKDAKQCFHKLDSEGKLLPCSEPQLLKELLTCKAAVNLQIKTWAQSRAEYTLSLEELKEMMEYYQCPDWVLKAIENQKFKIIKELVSSNKYKQHRFYADALAFNLAETLSNERVEQETSKHTS